MEEEIINIGIQLNILESLTRILSACPDVDDKIQYKDMTNLVNTILDKIINIKQQFNKLEKEMNV